MKFNDALQWFGAVFIMIGHLLNTLGIKYHYDVLNIVAFAIGTVITVLNIGVGVCTISAVTPGTTTVLSAGGTAASPTLQQYKSAACIKTGANAWYVVGAVS